MNSERIPIDSKTLTKTKSKNFGKTSDIKQRLCYATCVASLNKPDDDNDDDDDDKIPVFPWKG
jgi:hypothetical protein